MLPSAPARPTAADAEAADAAGAVTLVLSREVRAGHEQAFEDVLRRLSALVRRRSPASRSAASAGDAAAVMTRPRSCSPTAAGPDPGQVDDESVPGEAGHGAPARRPGSTRRPRPASGETPPPAPAPR